MREEASELLGMYPSKFDTGSIVSAWKEDSGGVSLLFGLFTTKKFEKSEIELANDITIISEELTEKDILETIPNEINDSVNIQFTLNTENSDSYSFDQNRQPRTCRRTSQEMEGFGIEYPAMCVEYWEVSNSDQSINEESEIELRDSLKQNFGIDLDTYPEYLNTVVTAVEDRRARIRFNESGEEMVRRLHEEPEDLDDEEILDIHDNWIIDANSISAEDLGISFRGEEYGQLLNEKPVSLDSLNRVSTDEAIDFVRSNQSIPSNRVVISYNSKERYELPDLSAPGASDNILKIVYNGALLDEYTMPVIRQIDLDININPSSTTVLSADSPDEIFESSDYEIFQYSWDQTLSISGENDLKNWIVEGDSDYREVMDVVHDLLNGTVKLVDPYLRPGRLSDLVDEADQDVNLWVITALPSGEMSEHRSDFEDIVSKAGRNNKDIHITWIPNSPTPLHDRFLLSKEQSLNFGTSFNSLRSNLTVVHEISENKAGSLEQNFDHWWTDARFKKENNVELIDTTY